MRDSSALAISAENYISNRLYRYRILLAKPLFDRNGADLLALRSVNDNAKFIRIQSKGRTITKEKKSFVSIPKSYVTSSFVVFLYIEVEYDQNKDIKSYLYCFFYEDINRWTQDENSFKLTIPTNFFEREYFLLNEFNEVKAARLIELIEANDQNKEFSNMLPNEIEILNNCLMVWRTVNIYPDANMLELFYMKIPLKALSIQQLIFLYYSSFLKNEELQELNEDISYELFFNEIKGHANTFKPILQEFTLLEVSSLTIGVIGEYHQFNKYIISEITVEVGSSLHTAMYVLCRDDNGEGIEMILYKDDLKNFRVRHIFCLAHKYDEDTGRNLISKIKS